MPIAINYGYLRPHWLLTKDYIVNKSIISNFNYLFMKSQSLCQLNSSANDYKLFCILQLKFCFLVHCFFVYMRFTTTVNNWLDFDSKNLKLTRLAWWKSNRQITQLKPTWQSQWLKWLVTRTFSDSTHLFYVYQSSSQSRESFD